MKKPMYFLVVLCVCTLFVSTTFVASAVSFEGDASYLFGLGSSKSRGFTAHAMVEVLDDVFVDGSFLSTSTKVAVDAAEEKGLSNSLIGVGGLYRTVNDPDLAVFVGAGFLRLTTKETGADDLIGQGIYGKFGFRFLPMPQLSVVAEISYAPKYKEKDTDTSGSLLSTRGTVSYEIMDGLGLQGTIKHYRASVTPASSDILVGGGITFRF
ncbi:MAG TPA: hypothetical protein VJZ70_02450 [Limnochordia bacterium]|nr:hypothetical protein [Limnochordia bacterium]